jgi:glycine/D-amino acid oxidase-like deaminating enzyme
MPRAPRVAIIGGGIGGLAAALALERRGVEAIVCEQAPALSEFAAGLNLTPNVPLVTTTPAASAAGFGPRSRRSGRNIG